MFERSPGPEPTPPAPGPIEESPTSCASKVERLTVGNVTAELWHRRRRNRYGGYFYRCKRIRIFRAGHLLRDEAPPRCDASCFPANAPAGEKSIRLRDLDADDEPEVVVDFWTGGASCCTYSLIYGYRPPIGGYEQDARNWGTAYRLRDPDGDGRLEFVGWDQRRFQYAFACGPCAALPPRIWRYTQGHIAVVTREFPAILRSAARRHWRSYLRARRHARELIRGRLATWVADQCLLGQCERGLRYVLRAQRRGELRRHGRYDFPPFGRAYIRKLKRLLRQGGYFA